MNPLQPEIHPLAPFLPPNARLLLLGSFPPPRKRWSMDFFYPNYTNDMWRIFGLIFFDANRLNGNASDLTLEVVEPLNLAGILDQIPYCHTLVTTGQKATDTLLSITGSPAPAIGGFVDFLYHNRRLRLYRMPSTSRAYPKPLTDKAEIYRTIFQNFEQ